MSPVPAPSRYPLKPNSLVQGLLGPSAEELMQRYRSTQLLLVKITAEDSDLTEWLDVAGQAPESMPPVSSGLMRYQTETLMQDELMDAADSNNQLRRRLYGNTHYIVPICKRSDRDSAFSSRVSVGRAPNKDILLRDPSVSKFHAWFERDEVGAIYLFDADSKNGTRVNGIALQPRTPHQVQPSETLEFGSINAFVCPVESLHHVLSHHSMLPPS